WGPTRRKRGQDGLGPRGRSNLSRPAASSGFLEGRLHGALEPGRDLQQLARGHHVAVGVEPTNTLGEVLRCRVFEARDTRRREMPKEDVSTVAEALHRGDSRAE